MHSQGVISPVVTVHRHERGTSLAIAVLLGLGGRLWWSWEAGRGGGERMEYKWS
jgi:hypothetical protein